MPKLFVIEGYDNIFEIVDQSRTQAIYGAISENGYAFYVTPFPDQVETY